LLFRESTKYFTTVLWLFVAGTYGYLTSEGCSSLSSPSLTTVSTMSAMITFLNHLFCLVSASFNRHWHLALDSLYITNFNKEACTFNLSIAAFIITRRGSYYNSSWASIILLVWFRVSSYSIQTSDTRCVPEQMSKSL